MIQTSATQWGKEQTGQKYDFAKGSKLNSASFSGFQVR